MVEDLRYWDIVYMDGSRETIDLRKVVRYQIRNLGSDRKFYSIESEIFHCDIEYLIGSLLDGKPIMIINGNKYSKESIEAIINTTNIKAIEPAREPQLSIVKRSGESKAGRKAD